MALAVVVAVAVAVAVEVAVAVAVAAHPCTLHLTPPFPRPPHRYYFSCLAPSLYFQMSPFHMLFNGMHLLLSPAGSHSGWEDHVQSDQFHYLHHAKFECNCECNCNVERLNSTQLGGSLLLLPSHTSITYCCNLTCTHPCH